jgi:Flp pilus assembly protein TadG
LKSRVSGSTAVEFALVLVIFWMFLFGILDFTRMLFTWGAANEASRDGARYAAICDDTANKAKVLLRMQRILPQIQDINLTWSPVGCTVSTCEGVNLTITSLNYQWISPLFGQGPLAAIAMPTFSTYSPREVMRQDITAASIACS